MLPVLTPHPFAAYVAGCGAADRPYGGNGGGQCATAVRLHRDRHHGRVGRVPQVDGEPVGTAVALEVHVQYNRATSVPHGHGGQQGGMLILSRHESMGQTSAVAATFLLAA